MREFRRGHTRLVAEILAHFQDSDEPSEGPSEESGLVYRLLHMETSKGYTPLHLAAARSDQSTAALLLDWGANPLIKCKAGKTALDISPDDGEEASALRSVLKAAQGFFFASFLACPVA
jgi:ankyrin repeat protein